MGKKKGDKHYNVAQLKNFALRNIMKRKFVFMSEVIAILPCSRNTVYDYGLNKDEDIIRALDENRLETKRDLRVRWAEPNANPILQIGLYKILGDQEEREALGVQRQAQNNIQININQIKELSDDELERLVEQGRQQKMGKGNPQPLLLNP